MPFEKKNIIEKESKADKFLRIAKPRTQKILKALTLLGNCGNRANYEYTKEQVEKIFNSIYSAYENSLEKFTQSKKEIETFDF